MTRLSPRVGFNISRFALIFAASLNLALTFLHPPWSSWWWWSVASTVVPLSCLIVVELRWHAGHRPPTREERLEMASQSSDPLGTMARMDYLDTLNRAQVNELVRWMREQAELDATWELDDLPPVVAGFIKSGLPPEALRDDDTE